MKISFLFVTWNFSHNCREIFHVEKYYYKKKYNRRSFDKLKKVMYLSHRAKKHSRASVRADVIESVGACGWVVGVDERLRKGALACKRQS
jgi:hypothetical protein